MNIGFIGAGRVGCTLGKYLSDAGIKIVGYYSRTLESADTAATFTKSYAFKDIKALADASDILFITTPDGVIEDIWKSVRNFDLDGKFICHFSGSLSSDIFSGIGAVGAYAASIHPMYAFSGKFTSYLKFHTACITLEGDEKAVEKMKGLFGDRLHHRIFTVATSDKIKYHAAAAFASNYVVGLIDIAVKLLGECGFGDADARSLIAPMAFDNMTAVMEKGTILSLTGPVERNDMETVQKHIDALADDKTILNVYKSLGRVLAGIAEEKNPERDYTNMKQLLKKQQ